MNATDFTTDSPGRLVWLPSEGVWTFVPEPLPPAGLEMNLTTVGLLDRASRALGELAGLGQMIPNPHLLIGPFLRREAILSSRIEGTYASMEQLVIFDAVPSRGTQDVLEVSNYVKTMGLGIKRLSELPISLRLIRELHAELLAGVRGEGKLPGEFRDNQNYIGQGGQSPPEARFIPPSPSDMMRALYDLERFLHEPSLLPPLINLALVHYQFETIHPFRDGNGRVGRLLIALQLCEQQLLPAPLLYLSGYFEKNREQYDDHLLHVSQRGRWNAWVDFFLTGVAEQSNDAIQRARHVLDLWRQYRERFQTVRGSALLLKLIDELFANPVMTVSTARGILGVTPRSAGLNVGKLVDADILTEVGSSKRNRLYLAEEIINVATAT